MPLADTPPVARLNAPLGRRGRPAEMARLPAKAAANKERLVQVPTRPPIVVRPVPEIVKPTFVTARKAAPLAQLAVE